MLTASGLARSYGPRDLFTDVTLQLSAGRRIALVGGNGTGKTSLIEILVGDAEPDAGSITRPRDMTLGYLPQDLVDTATGSVIEEVLAGAGDMAALAERLHRHPRARPLAYGVETSCTHRPFHACEAVLPVRALASCRRRARFGRG